MIKKVREAKTFTDQKKSELKEALGSIKSKEEQKKDGLTQFYVDELISAKKAELKGSGVNDAEYHSAPVDKKKSGTAIKSTLTNKKSLASKYSTQVPEEEKKNEIKKQIPSAEKEQRNESNKDPMNTSTLFDT